MLKDIKIQALIAERAKALTDASFLTADEVLRSLARAVRFDPRLLYNEDGSLKSVHELPDEIALELEGIEIDQTARKKKLRGGKVLREGSGDDVGALVVTTSKISFPKKHAARDQAMRFFGMFAKDKPGHDPGEDSPPPSSIPVVIDFKDARRKRN